MLAVLSSHYSISNLVMRITWALNHSHSILPGDIMVMIAEINTTMAITCTKLALTLQTSIISSMSLMNMRANIIDRLTQARRARRVGLIN